MSLINEALKKAQRQRTEAAAGGANPADSTLGIAKRAEPKSAKSTVLIAVAVLVLVVIAVTATAWWITRPISHPAEIAKAPAKPATEAAVSAAPTLVVPLNPSSTPVAGKVATRPSMSETKVPGSTAATGVNAGSPATAMVTAAPAAVAETAPAVPEIKPAPVTPQPDPRVRQFVDAVRVTGIRSSGAESKVLMNDRVYRVNQVVNAEFGVRLTKVSSDSLTFTDRNGIEYVKYF